MKKIPIGIFLITHHEIKGPEIKVSYFNRSFNLTQEFISQLYMTHAGFSKTYNLEMKFEQNKIISYFTGNKDRKINAEGILGLVFEIDEDSEDILLFLRRNIGEIIVSQEEETIKEIFLIKLPNYLGLLKFFKKFKVEYMDEMLFLEGNEKFKTCYLKNTNKNKPINEISELYDKINYKKKLLNYYYFPLETGQMDNIFIIIKYTKKGQKVIKDIMQIIIPYLEQNFNYALEILIVFFMPHLVTYQKKWLVSEGEEPKKISLLNRLKRTNRYRSDFNSIISRIVENKSLLIPL